MLDTLLRSLRTIRPALPTAGCIARHGLTLHLLLFLAVLALAAAFRLPSLATRPMHHDEANQAVRCCDLLATGIYHYDPSEHHGPSLYYCALAVARLVAGHNPAATTERTFRLVPVIAGIAAVLLLWFLRDAVGAAGAVAAALLMAVSPAMVYFSRFFIQEMLLVLFTLGIIAAGWRYCVRPRPLWAIACGLAAGLLYATKETSLLTFAAMLAAFVVSGALASQRRALCRGSHIALGVCAAILVAALLYTSRFSNMKGLLDSLRAFGIYAHKFTSDQELHPGPWYYYLALLAIEWPTLVLAAIGIAAACFTRVPASTVHPVFLRFLAIYTVLTLTGYSLSPHKTPWCVLSSTLGVLLLAGAGVAFLTGFFRTNTTKVLLLLVLVGASCFLADKTIWYCFSRPADERTPYAYLHTSTDFLKMVKRIHSAAQTTGQGTNMYIQVVTTPIDAWPLPWYLRAYPRVGYWTNAVSVPSEPAPSVIIATPDFADELEPRIGSNYHRTLFGLRPGVFIEYAERKGN